MAPQYVSEYVIELECKFDFLVRILLEKLLCLNLKKSDICDEFERLPFSLQQQYGYLWENADQVAKESASVKEYLIKMSVGVNFINTRTLVEYMLDLYADTVEIKYMKSFFSDLQRKLSKISVPEFQGTFVSMPLPCFCTLTLELDPMWYHKSMEDLMKFQRSFPFRKWYFIKVVVVGTSLRIIYGLQRAMRLHQVELAVLKSHGVVRVFEGDKLIAECSSKFRLVSGLPELSLYNKSANEGCHFEICPQPELKGVKMSADHLSMEKHHKALYKPCTAYSKLPLHGESLFEIECTLNALTPAAYLVFGIHRVLKGKPIAMASGPLLPYGCNDYCVWHDGTLWDSFSSTPTARPYGNMHLTDLLPKCTVSLTISTQGELMLYVDGKNQGLAALAVYDSSHDVYAAVTLLEGCESIRVTKAVTDIEVLPPDQPIQNFRNLLLV